MSLLFLSSIKLSHRIEFTMLNLSIKGSNTLVLQAHHKSIALDYKMALKESIKSHTYKKWKTSLLCLCSSQSQRSWILYRVHNRSSWKINLSYFWQLQSNRTKTAIYLIVLWILFIKTWCNKAWEVFQNVCRKKDSSTHAQRKSSRG